LSIYDLKNLNFSFYKRNAPRSGPTSSDKWNDSFEEIKNDLANLSNEWNQKLIKTLAGLPVGDSDSSINAVANGLDGANLWVNRDADSSSTYYDTTNARPLSVEEALDAIHTLITNTTEDLQDYIAEHAAALSSAEEAAIGAHIFDASQTSSSTSLDGKSETNRLNINQLARDVYGSVTLNGNGNAVLNNSLLAMVDALLEIHNGNWDDDITVDHSGVSISVSQTGINSSAPGDDSFAGAPTNLEEDLDQIRTLLKTIKGTLTWQTALSALYAGGPDSLEDLFTSTAGTGVKAAGNPWGYDLVDLDGLATGLDSLPTQLTGSGLPDGVPDGIAAQDMFEWMVDASTTIDGQYFRRMETGVEGPGPYVVYHGRGSYPVVQLVQLSPTVTVSGQFDYTIEHDNTNQFTVEFSEVRSLASGVIISVW